MKQRIRLTESQLYNVIRKCVNEAICDGTQKDIETRKAWKDFEYQNSLPDFGSEKTCYNRKPTIKTPNGRTLINAHGVAGDENLNVHDLGGSAAMNAMSDDPDVSRNAKNLRSTLSQTGNPTITLPESQLHDVIRKCVNEAINEMDPRTYANYARAREAQGKPEKAQQGRDAAVNAWNKQYGEHYSDKKYNNGELISMDDGYDEMQPTNTDNYSRSIYKSGFRKYQPDYKYAYRNYPSYYSDGSRAGWGYNGVKGETYDMADKDLMDKGGKVAYQMATGTGKYTKGKGWE